MRNIAEPDMQFILDRLPLLASPRRAKPDVEELLKWLDWSAQYSWYKHQQYIQDKKEDRESINSQHAFFEKLKDRKDGREYVKGMIDRDYHVAFRQKRKPLTPLVQAFTFERDIQKLIEKYSTLIVEEQLPLNKKKELIRKLLLLLRDGPVWKEEMYGISGWVPPLTASITDLIDDLAGLNDEPRYRRRLTEAKEVYDEDYEDPLSYDLNPTDYLTTYNDYARLFAHLNPQPGQTFVEIGAGFARASLVLDILYPGVQYIGYELVPERLREVSGMIKRMKFENADIIKADVLAPEFKIATADFYYMYNPKEFNPLPALRAQLQKIAQRGDPLMIIIPERRQSGEEKEWLKRVPLPRSVKMIRTPEIYDIKPR